MINALNSGARVFMADLEDALSPTWANVIDGQAAIADATRGTLTFDSPEGKAYRLNEDRATLVVRPRGWHLIESHVLVDGVPISASLFDFGLYLFHSGARGDRGRQRAVPLPAPSSSRTTRRGSGTTSSSTPRRRSGSRAARSGRRCSSRRSSRPSRWTRSSTSCASTRRASTPAAGTTCSARSRSSGPTRGSSTPDRAQLTMTVPFMRAYTELLVKTCHGRGAHAIGGMAAFIPNRRDPDVTEPRRWRRSERTRSARAATGSTGRGSPIRTWCRWRWRSSTASWATARTRRTGPRDEVAVVAPSSCWTSRSTAVRSPRPASARTSASRWRTSIRGCAASAPPPSTT